MRRTPLDLFWAGPFISFIKRPVRRCLLPPSCDPFVTVPVPPSCLDPASPASASCDGCFSCFFLRVLLRQETAGLLASVERWRRSRLGFRQARLLPGFRQGRCLGPRQPSSISASTSYVLALFLHPQENNTRSNFFPSETWFPHIQVKL